MGNPINFIGNDRLKEIFQYIKDVLPTKATTTKEGIVKPDGTTITVNDGVISVVGGGGSDVEVAPALTEGVKIADISVDGEVSTLYSPTMPTNLSDFTNDLIASNSVLGTVKGDGNSIEIDSDGVMSVNTTVIATEEEAINLGLRIDDTYNAIPSFSEYTDEEIEGIVWSEMQFTPKPEYTEEDLDAILDTIDFSGGGGGGAKEMTSETMMAIWNEVFDE